MLETQKRRITCKKCGLLHYSNEDCPEYAIKPLDEHPKWTIEQSRKNGTPIEGTMRRMEALEDRVNQLIDIANKEKLCQNQV
jgi:hypothetical protein